MNALIKIQEVSHKYDITARTLRYYEDMGLISSTRNDDYAYRLYDEAAIKRLEQILVLRKLNINIRDIKRIFSSSDSDVVLDVLGKKVQNIDDEVALLHELKEIVLGFIRQIEQIDFNNDSNVKMLYERAKEIETQLVKIDYIGKPSNVSRFLEVTEKLEKRPDIRIVDLPPCRMITSGSGDKKTQERFYKLWSKLDEQRKDKFFQRDFMVHVEPPEEGHPAIWWYAIEDWVSEKDTDGFEIFQFEGGLFATAMTYDWDDNITVKAYYNIMDWIAEHDRFIYDDRPGHHVMFNALGPDDATRLGFIQGEYYFPIGIKETMTQG
jgi:DNA-binding transcriptional MerR regulator